MNVVAPSRIGLEASSFCQLRCPSCPTATGAIDAAIGRGFLTLDNFRALLERNPALCRIELSNYGEVLLNPELIDILEYAHRVGVMVTLDNGVNLNHARDEALEALVKYRVLIMTCSIDGASPETYAKYRVRGDFDTVIGNIERINHYKRQYGSARPLLNWQFVVFGYNEHEIPAARAMASRLGMTLTPKLTWDPHFSPVRDPDLVRRETGIAATRAEYEEHTGDKFMSNMCHQLWDRPQINWDGKVLGCCRNFWGDFGGNAFDDGLAAAVNNEKIAHARDMLLGRAEPRADVPCTTCEIYESMRERGKWLRRDGRPTGANLTSAPRERENPARSP